MENETEDEKCVQSSAGSLRCCRCALTRLYVLHRIQRKADALKKTQKSKRKRDENETEDEK